MTPGMPEQYRERLQALHTEIEASIVTLAVNFSVNLLRFLPITMRPFVPC